MMHARSINKIINMLGLCLKVPGSGCFLRKGACRARFSVAHSLRSQKYLSKGADCFQFWEQSPRKISKSIENSLPGTNMTIYKLFGAAPKNFLDILRKPAF
jgi:hypothetical protein